MGPLHSGAAKLRDSQSVTNRSSARSGAAGRGEEATVFVVSASWSGGRAIDGEANEARAAVALSRDAAGGVRGVGIVLRFVGPGR